MNVVLKRRSLRVLPIDRIFTGWKVAVVVTAVAAAVYHPEMARRLAPEGFKSLTASGGAGLPPAIFGTERLLPQAC
jgi:hypothetical protein